ncbi:MAG TPA: phosphonate ABC transporter, permease protein PhnE [Usitatibacter sp.]|jgi:phosphonate transport system permease protein
MDARVESIALARRRGRRVRFTIYFAIAALVAWSVKVIVVEDTDWQRLLGSSVLSTVKSFLDVDLSLVKDLWEPALETVLMATVATLAGLVLSIPVAWLGAANITPFGKTSYYFGRFLMTMSRSVHEIVWGLIFVSAVGLGTLAGVLAMAVRSIGFISKTIAEAIEDVDPKPVEAMRAVGATRFQILIFAILPQIVPVFVGNMIFEWDINIRRSTILGLVGAGGLGLLLFRQMAMSNFGGITTVILAILALIVFGEVFSHYARKAVI